MSADELFTKKSSLMKAMICIPITKMMNYLHCYRGILQSHLQQKMFPVRTGDHSTWHHQCYPQKTSGNEIFLINK